MDPAYDDPHNGAFYCPHGTYIGSPYGPDYLCPHCEDGTTVEELAEYAWLEKQVFINRLTNMCDVLRHHPSAPYSARDACLIVEVVERWAEEKGITLEDLADA